MPPRRNDAELGEVAAQRIDERHAPSNQEVADAVCDERRLVLWRFHCHEAHGRPTHRLTDRFSIGDIVLVAPHVRLYVAGWRQPHVVPERGDLTRPKLCGAACLHSNKTRPKSGEKGGNLAATQMSARPHFSVRIDTVQLENVLRGVDAMLVISPMNGPRSW